VSNKPLDEIFCLPTESQIDPNAPVFETSPISSMERRQVDESPNITIKTRDPTLLLIQTFIARHGLRLVGFFPQVQQGRIYCDGRTKRGTRPLGAQKGLTRIPSRATMTDEGKRFVSLYEESRARRYKPVTGEAAYREQADIRSMAFEDRLSVQASGMSLADGNPRMMWDKAIKGYRQVVPDSQKLPREGELTERHCLNPECLDPIDENQHHNIKYCDDECAARAKELRRLQRKIRKAGQPILYRNESDVPTVLSNDTNQLETGVISHHISRGIVSKDCPAEVAVYQR
jgi:hypothetical protein